MCERKQIELLHPLRSAIDRVYATAIRYYNASKGTGATATDISAFFRNKKGRDKEFVHFWGHHDNRSRRPFESSLEKARTIVDTYELK